jgi:hypothetical protein
MGDETDLEGKRQSSDKVVAHGKTAAVRAAAEEIIRHIGPE